MGVATFYDEDEGRAVMYCNTSDWAFGPIFHDESARSVPDDCELLDARDLCELFQLWLVPDARMADRDGKLEEAYRTFLEARADGMYPKLTGEGCDMCGNDIGHHEKCPSS
jgi:hypothetical protein